MGQILVRNLDDDLIERLKARAAERGTSLEQVARDALAEAANRSDRQAFSERARALRGMTTLDPSWDSVAEIRRARDALADRAETGGRREA